MFLFKNSFKRKWLISILIVGVVCALLNILYFGVSLMRAPVPLHVQYLIDDAFYYLQLVKNYVEYRTWTFDNGISKTSGFHPLWAYILLGIYYIFHPSSENFVVYAIALSTALTVLTGMFCFWKAVQQRNIYWLLVIVLLVTSKNVMYNSLSAMEWSLTVLFSVTYYYRIYSGSDRKNYYSATAIFMVGLFASLARLDFLVTAVAICVAGIVIQRSFKKIVIPVVGLIGSLVGVFLASLQFYVFTGEYLQSSAKIKVFWAQFYPGWRILTLYIFDLVGPHLFVGLLIIVSIFLIKSITKISVSKAFHSAYSFFRLTQPRDRQIVLSSLLSIVIYYIVYNRSGTIHAGYTAHIIVPLAIILVYAFSSFESFLTQAKQFQLIVIFLVLITAAHNISQLYPISPQHASWPFQSILLIASHDLKQRGITQNIGAWNAGILGYNLKGAVVNLDGLVNNAIYPYVVENKLSEYIESQKLDYLIDYDFMFKNRKMQISRGFYNPKFLKRLDRIAVYEAELNGNYSYIHLYKIRD